MKGVKKSYEEKLNERNDFVRQLFVQNFKERQKDGFVDPPLSCPKAQREFKRKFGVNMNSQRMYDLRRAIFLEQGLNEKGRPTAKLLNGHTNTTQAPTLTTANRTEDDPLFHVAVINIEDEVQGLAIRDALGKLAEKKLVPETLKVDAIHGHYMTVSNFPTK